jgi:hypothetical protein
MIHVNIRIFDEHQTISDFYETGNTSWEKFCSCMCKYFKHYNMQNKGYGYKDLCEELNIEKFISYYLDDEKKPMDGGIGDFLNYRCMLENEMEKYKILFKYDDIGDSYGICLKD